MPTYVYRREDDGTTFEVEHSIHDDAIDKVYDHFCDWWVPVRRVPQSPGIKLVGKGFYRTGG